MSLNKIAKAINNLAESIRYHADHAGKAPILPMFGRSHGSVEGTTAPQNIPRYEGPEIEPPVASIPEDCDGFATNDRIESECYAAEGFSASELLAGENMEAAVIAADRMNADHTLTVDELPKHSDARYAPGWQTLTVEELDAAPPPPPNDDAAPPTPSDKEAEPSEYDVEFAPEGVTVDANGLPWDARIHSSGKTLLADGTWRLKRNVPDDERAEIEAELKQLMAIPVPPVNDAVAPPPPAGTAKITVMPQLIKAITGAGLGAMMVTEAVKSVGLENISQLGARPDLVPAVAEALGL